MLITFITILFINTPIFKSAQALQIDEDVLLSYRNLDSFVELKGGEFMMGINDKNGVNGEYPERKAIVHPFRMHLYPVTVAAFKRYKNDKFNHRTDAEQSQFSWVFSKLVNRYARIDEKKNEDDNVFSLFFLFLKFLEF